MYELMSKWCRHTQMFRVLVDVRGEGAGGDEGVVAVPVSDASPVSKL